MLDVAYSEIIDSYQCKLIYYNIKTCEAIVEMKTGDVERFVFSKKYLEFLF